MSRCSYLYSNAQTSMQTPLVVRVLSDSTFCSVIVSAVMMMTMMKVMMLFCNCTGCISGTKMCFIVCELFCFIFIFPFILFHFILREAFSVLSVHLPTCYFLHLPMKWALFGGWWWWWCVCVCVCVCGVCALIHDVTCAPGAQQGALFRAAEPVHRAAAPDNWCWFPHPRIVNLKNQLTREPHLALWCSARCQQAHITCSQPPSSGLCKDSSDFLHLGEIQK